MNLKKIDLMLITLLSLAGVISGVYVYLSSVEPSIAALVPFIFCYCIALCLVVFRRRHRTRKIEQAWFDYRQTESLLNIHNLLPPGVALPPTRNGATSPDLLQCMALAFKKGSPGLVVEFGSGASTVLFATLCKQAGNGARVISFEHDQRWVALVEQWLDSSGLSEFASVIYAPLLTIRGDEAANGYEWYDGGVFLNALAGLSKIDFVYVDGPPMQSNYQARYPALPMIKKLMHAETQIFVDDTDRGADRAIVDRWCSELDLDVVWLPMEKGAAQLTLKERKL